MSATYEPGTFVRVRYGDVDQVGIVRPRKSAAGNLEVAYASGEYDMLGSLRPTRRADVRPLVVIDPEDRDQVERLADLFGVFPGVAARHLREFANPTLPKPAEPQGLGAVVEDAKSCLWVRSDLDEDFPWTAVGQPDELHGYREIAAVSILSEGVTPC